MVGWVVVCGPPSRSLRGGAVAALRALGTALTVPPSILASFAARAMSAVLNVYVLCSIQ